MNSIGAGVEPAVAEWDSRGVTRPLVPMVVTVLVNWRGAADTIECLESLLASDYSNNYVVIVDNGSGDGSVERIVDWSRGHASLRRQMSGGGDPALGPLASNPMAVMTEHQPVDASLAEGSTRVYLIRVGSNLGFAGGVNVGIRFATANSRVDYVWVLNNDTVVAPDCLSHMLRRMREDGGLGMCGSRVVFYSDRERVQALGGAEFRSWTGTSRLIGHRQPTSAAVDVAEVERRIDHLSGASMLVSRRYVEEIGMMDESYFLYYEETDWAMRGRGRFRMGYAHDAIVYHKEGASIGSSHELSKRSPLSFFFLVKSRLKFTRRFYPWALPSVLAYSVLVAARALFQGRRDQAKAIVSAIRGLAPEQAIGWRPD